MLSSHYFYNIYKDKFKKYLPAETNRSFRNTELIRLGYSSEEIKKTNELATQLGLSSGRMPGDIFDKAVFGTRKLFTTFKNLEKLNMPIENFYKLNSHSLRSDDFITEHSGKHILFAGCSVTTGEGLPLEYTWAHKLYTKISSGQDTSGYFNISYPGASILGIIKQIYSYVENFGSPDYIFALLPNLGRDTPRERGLMGRVDRETYDIILQECIGLEKFCLKNKIRLFLSGWELHEEPDFRLEKDLPAYKAIDHTRLVRHIYDFSDSNANIDMADFLLTAMDAEHPGIAIQDYYYTMFYEMLIGSHGYIRD